MKAPLFLFVTLFLICILSGCRKSSYFYNHELPCGKVNGDVKKVTDTIYTVINGEMAYPLSTHEYGFDSCRRLTEEQYCLYYTAGADEDVTVSIRYRELTKHRYDQDGRKVESHINTYIYENDSVATTATLMRLSKLDGNNETWEIRSTDKDGKIRNVQMYRKYEKDKVLTDYTTDGSKEKSHAIHLFDESGNLVEYNFSLEDNLENRIIYKYNKENQLIESLKRQPDSNQVYKTTYQMDEYDNEGNWLKRIELDENNEIKSIMRRRIEYKIKL